MTSVAFSLIRYHFQTSLQQMFEKRRRRRESHNAVERRRRDNINDKIQGKGNEGNEHQDTHVHVCIFAHMLIYVLLPSELSQLLPEHLSENLSLGSTNLAAGQGVGAAANTSAAQKAVNKGTILKMSVDHIKNLKSDATRYQARIKELESMLEAAKNGEYVDFDALQQGRMSQGSNPNNNMVVIQSQYQPYNTSAPIPLRNQQQQPINLSEANRRPQPHQRTGSMQFQQQFGNLHIDSHTGGVDDDD